MHATPAQMRASRIWSDFLVQKFHELVLLYKSNGLHQRALEMLAKLGTQPGPLQGTRMTIRYLKSLGSDNIEAILQFSKWPLEIAPAEALDVRSLALLRSHCFGLPLTADRYSLQTELLTKNFRLTLFSATFKA